ncbi:MAG: DNA cytosine methyltransferase [Clostridia bacterium]|nr:DNA cytosine methyltransferase [Clostridia bacterium]
MKSFIDLFAGCGGLGLGMEQAGFSVAFASDIDPICSNTYRINRHLNDSQMFIGDIADLNKQYYELFGKKFLNIDLVCGGPPCQGFSMANRQRLINDPRNVLYKEYLLFLQKCKPKFFVMENVRGMLNKIDEILIDITTILGKEYDISYTLLNAKNFGIPQNRERLILIGNRLSISSASIIKRINDRMVNMPKFTLYDAIGDLPPLQPNRIKHNKDESKETGLTKVEYSYSKTRFYTFINGNKDINWLYNHKNRYNNDRDIEIFSRLPQGGNSLHDSIADIMPYKTRNAIFKDKYYKLKYDEICKTITSHMKFDCNMYIHPTQARGLSPREAARIQTFPDDFVFYGPQNSWYKQIGNAVPVKLAQIIGEEIIKCL